jgi:glycosyltransferase involved in cell wall biosynthesis
MKVIFYTATCYMDTSVEIINVLKDFVELHVIIEIAQGSKNQTIIDVEALPDNVDFADPETLLSPTSYSYLKPYIEGTASTKFLVYNNKNALSYLNKCYKIYNYVSKIKPDILHLEAMLIRSACLLPALFKVKNIFASIHDPVPHLGENDAKINALKNIFLRHAKLKGIFFYSQFAKEQFEGHYVKNHTAKLVIKMKALSYFKNFRPAPQPPKKNILFFGRISPYKGIDVLLKAMPAVFKRFPNEHLVIAGRSINNYQVSEQLTSGFADRVTIMNRHISNHELVQLISEAKFVVCPYLEATQSGVLMTSFAINTPVIATAVGAFTEYVDESKNGSLVPANNPEILAAKIIQFLEQDLYNTLTNNMILAESVNAWAENEILFKTAYRI